MPTPQHADRFAPFPFPTPAFVYQEDRLLESLRRLEPLRANPKCRVLYSIKSCSLPDVLEFLSTRVDGFSASSLFEARLAREILDRNGAGKRGVHLTCPAFPEREAAELGRYVDHINFNSLEQWLRDRARKHERPIRCGLRVNPKLSFVKDERYNPCRRYSKLGIPIEQLVDAIETRPDTLDGISGIHVHTNCE
ncbi:MAG TPA: 2Fe-2S ferredoxin, partial [Myxococcota bacterium]|nr:2Fe-2S ferredoxin [Myxococcota bacterium]